MGYYRLLRWCMYTYSVEINTKNNIIFSKKGEGLEINIWFGLYIRVVVLFFTNTLIYYNPHFHSNYTRPPLTDIFTLVHIWMHKKEKFVIRIMPSVQHFHTIITDYRTPWHACTQQAKTWKCITTGKTYIIFIHIYAWCVKSSKTTSN